MPTANGEYYDHASTAYDDYDDLSESSHQTNSMHWNPEMNGVHTNGHAEPDLAYKTPPDERTSYQLPLNPRTNAHPQDDMSRHMLYETALMDCKAYDVLTLEEVDTLKKELARLSPRIDAVQRKLILENKVRDAAQNLQKLNTGRGRRADTPQNPESPRKTRRSLLGQRQSSSSATGNNQQIEEELTLSQKKIEELHETLKSMIDRRAQVERSLLRHTAAILAHQREQDSALLSSRHQSLDDDAVSEYEPDEFDGIRDILGGKTISKSSKRVISGRMQEEHEEQLHSMQLRLEQLNRQMRHVIEEAGRVRGVLVPPELLQPVPSEPVSQLDQDLARLESNVAMLAQEQQDANAHLTQLQAHGHDLNVVGTSLGDVNNNLHQALLNAPAARDLELSQPPQTADHHQQIGYLQTLLQSVEHTFHAHHEDKATLAKTAGHSQKLDEYEATVSGLWDILSADNPSAGDDGASRSPRLSESFSLAAFSSRVQHVFDRATSAKDQQNILHRQIQQQRDLNNRSDEEKNKELVDLQGNHQQMLAAHEKLQDELARTMANHASSENEASQLRVELSNVENEFEQLREIAETKHQEHGEMARQLQVHQANHQQASNELRDAQDQLASLTTSKGTKDKEVADLESEVVRLTTELTMAKAELDGAYGSRAERAREAQAGEVEGLKDRAGALEKELTEMTGEFQELTKESLELERERSQLETMIDGLRERCEALESQLSDERVRWLGVKSTGTGEQQIREQTSMTVLRAEFKKMMRDARAEGIRHLRAEQEQRRAMEAEIRRIRQANTPLRKAPNDAAVAS